jgi:hypothetical protein
MTGGWAAVLRTRWPTWPGAGGFRRTGWGTGFRAQVSEPPADTGWCQFVRLGRLLPGPPQIGGQRPGQPELGIGGDHQPCPPVGRFRAAKPGLGPPERLLEQAKKPGRRMCWRPVPATARRPPAARADRPLPSAAAPRPGPDAVGRRRSGPGSVRRTELHVHDGVRARARDRPASAPARPCTAARRITRIARRLARSDTRTAPTGSVTLPRTHPAGRPDAPNSRPRPSH